jgi:hypothetical protein
MPVHNWKRAEPNLYHHFHQMWTMHICDALNGGLLPTGFSALIDQRSPKVAPLAERANRIAIHHPLGEIVCVMEIISPGNKSSKSALTKFIDKSIEFLERGVHLVVVDLFPPTRRDPQGIHKAIWDEIDEEEPFELPSDQPLTLAAYVVGDALAEIPPKAYVHPVGVGETMLDMPAYLDFDNYVPVPLEATYMATWARCPADFRSVVETGIVPGE